MAVWFVGYTPQVATAAMVAGANSLGHWVSLNGQYVGGAYIGEAFGSTVAGPIWGEAMAAISDKLDYEDFQAPAGDEIAGVLTTVPDVSGMSVKDARAELRVPRLRDDARRLRQLRDPQGRRRLHVTGSRHLARLRRHGRDLPVHRLRPACRPKKGNGKGKGGRGNGAARAAASPAGGVPPQQPRRRRRAPSPAA